ncbi:hypothetical protein GCM10010411_50770 [Actinomadura fulvescens]|uniref:Uncharacterized protein n=2 Tax=Actinomadura fulvescens TaxID=46160 RepID=A0ABP6CCZ6_9ACTN
MRTASQHHGHVRERVDVIMLTALRADPVAIDTFLTEPGGTRLDSSSKEFLRESRRLTLACAAVLTRILGAHRPGRDPYGDETCAGCGTPDCRTLKGADDILAAYTVHPLPVDRAEAWRRADAYLGGAPGTPLTIEEFDDGFIARPSTPGAVADRFLLVVDRRSGSLTRWPVLPTEQLIDDYRRYQNGVL